MDPTTQQALNQFVQQILASAQSAATWTVGQAPLVVQEWLRWQQYQAMILIGYFTLGVLLSVGFARNRLLAMRSRIAEDRYVDKDGYVAGIVLGCVLGAGLVLGVAINLLALGKIAMAPRVVVLEKFADLIK